MVPAAGVGLAATYARGPQKSTDFWGSRRGSVFRGSGHVPRKVANASHSHLFVALRGVYAESRHAYLHLGSYCAGGGGRTRTLLPGLDFESSTSADSITPASVVEYSIDYQNLQVFSSGRAEKLASGINI